MLVPVNTIFIPIYPVQSENLHTESELYIPLSEK